MPGSKKKLVVIGGGTGTSVLLRGLKKYPLHLSAIVTTADTGGSSGRLRKEMGIVPPGDARQCFVALNEDQHPAIPYFNERFSKGKLKGHAFGNLFLALLWRHYGDFQKAVEELENFVASEHSVIPATIKPTNLVAHLKTGKKVYGEANITQVNGLNKKLNKLELLPRNIKLNTKAELAIKNADYIIVGPGNLFASLTPPLLVKNMADAIINSRAKKLFVVNLMNQHKLTRNFLLHDHLNYIINILGQDIFDAIIYNTGSIKDNLLKKFKIKDRPVLVNITKLDSRYLGTDLVSNKIFKQNPKDVLKRTLVRHDSDKIAKVIYKIINAKN